ncbi:MAG TPA: selenocysteine-specific translation elongation factor [Bacteroidales bacterium]|nr:selenocysteine-specific translation elongation factor [Bacteroidales bacterium]HOG66717.1 selenocysteine-specific translation elongation factor [Bacteroidales bacterium]
MGTAGHVDHGKTSLIKALTGIDGDTHKEEKKRGITINLGFSHLDLDDKISLGIVDVPGHKDFVKTMIAGAHGIDFVLLVIAADSGIMPQTREHFNIIKMLGIKHGLIALNKSDLVDDETIELAKLEIMEFVDNSTLEHAPIVPVSATTGFGLEALKSVIKRVAEKVDTKTTTNQFRMYVDRIFNVKGIGIVVTGSVLGGEASIGEELFLLPGSHNKLKIKGLERHGRQVEKIIAGDRAAINLSGLKYNDFEKGMILTKIILPEIKLLDVVLELFPGNQRVGIWSQMIFHTGNFSSKARIHLLNKNEINGSETAFAQIHLEKPAILLNRDRFVIRNTSNDLTIGGGIIIDNRPLHHKKRTKTLSRYLETLAQATTDHENLSALILLELNKSALPLTTETIASTLNKTINEVENAILDVELQSAILVYENKNYLIPKAFIEKNNKRIIETLKVWHLQNPLSESGLELREIAGKVKIMGDFNIYMLGKILEKMTFEKVIRTVGATFVLKEHKVSFDRKTQEQIIWLEEIIRDSGMQRATINEVEAIALTRNIKKGQLVKLLQYLAANDKIFFNGEDILHNSLVRKIRLKLLQNLSENPRGINEKEFRLLVDGTKRAIQALVNLFVQEGIIEKQTFYLLITEKGKELLL